MKHPKTYLKTFKILPKSQNFSKYGHTVSDAKFASKFHPESKVIRLPRMEPLKIKFALKLTTDTSTPGEIQGQYPPNPGHAKINMTL